jgi:hypothetical protein
MGQQRRYFIAILVASVALTVSTTVAAVAQVPGPPDLGTILYEHSLTEGGPTPFTCPTGLAGTEQGANGYLLKVSGKCAEGSASASVGPTIDDLQVSDGEVRVEGLVQSAADRAQLGIAFRRQIAIGSFEGGDDGYYALAWPANGLVSLTRIRDGQAAVLVQRTDLVSAMNRTLWNTLAVRAKGPHIWVIVNDRIAVSVTDEAFSSGATSFFARRAGNVDDATPMTILFRNVKVSSLADGTPGHGTGDASTMPGW